ncbi:MAG: hypothetical protein AAFU77_09330 [Myxococcota bacterium]
MDGEHDAVWLELRRLGEVPSDSPHFGDAWAVAEETMRRARYNIEHLVEVLGTQGYEFGDPYAENDRTSAPHIPPSPAAGSLLDTFESQAEQLPIVLRAYILNVGDVNLLGQHPKWSTHDFLDPLVVEFECAGYPDVNPDLERTKARFVEEFGHRAAHGASPLTIEFAPDYLHKSDTSGGLPYGIVVPDASVDATIVYRDGMYLSFVEYLREVFRMGGFPGFQQGDGGESLNELQDRMQTI